MANIELKTWANGVITPQLDAIVRDGLSNSGIMYGCASTYAGANTIHIDAGFGILRGRQFVIMDHDETVTMPESGTVSGRIYVLLDLANTDDPVSIVVETTTGTFGNLPTDDNINYDNGSEGMELCTFTAGIATITDLTDTFPKFGTSVKLANNLVTEVEGYALDARQGKALGYKITEINSNLKWKTLNPVTGNGNITLPSSFSEIHIYCRENTSNVSFVFHILPSDLSGISIRNGFYINSGSYGACIFNINSSTSINLNIYSIAGTNYTSSAITSISYR